MQNFDHGNVVEEGVGGETINKRARISKRHPVINFFIHSNLSMRHEVITSWRERCFGHPRT